MMLEDPPGIVLKRSRAPFSYIAQIGTLTIHSNAARRLSKLSGNARNGYLLMNRSSRKGMNVSPTNVHALLCPQSPP